MTQMMTPKAQDILNRYDRWMDVQTEDALRSEAREYARYPQFEGQDIDVMDRHELAGRLNLLHADLMEAVADEDLSDIVPPITLTRQGNKYVVVSLKGARERKFQKMSKAWAYVRELEGQGYRVAGDDMNGQILYAELDAATDL